MPRGVFIHTSKPYNPWCALVPSTVWDVGCILHIGVGFGVARFRHSGFARASRSEASNNAKLHAFFVSIQWVILTDVKQQYSLKYMMFL